MDAKIKKNISESIKALRRQRNITQRDAAMLAGLSVSGYSNIETGRTDSPDLSTLNKIADVFGVSVNDIMAGKFLDPLKQLGFHLSGWLETNDISELVKKTGIRAGILRRFADGKISHPTPETVAKISCAIGFDIENVIQCSDDIDSIEGAKDSPIPPTMRRIPIFGKIEAGYLGITITETGNTIDFADSMLPQGIECFGMIVHGDSMDLDGYHEGDLVILRRASECQSGEVCAVNDGEITTLKRLVLVDGVWWMLPHSSNPEHQRKRLHGLIIGVEVLRVCRPVVWRA